MVVFMEDFERLSERVRNEVSSSSFLSRGGGKEDANIAKPSRAAWPYLGASLQVELAGFNEL